MNNKQVANNWRQQTNKGKNGSHMFYEGRTIYSYGYHFPMAYITNMKHDGKTIILQNSDSYSNSTARHLSYMRSECYDDAIIAIRTGTLKQAIKEYKVLGKMSQQTIDTATEEIEKRLAYSLAKQARARTLKDAWQYDIDRDIAQLQILGKEIRTTGLKEVLQATL